MPYTLDPWIELEAGSLVDDYKCAIDISLVYLKAKRKQKLLESLSEEEHPYFETERDFVGREALKQAVFLKPEEQWECMYTNLESMMEAASKNGYYQRAALIRDALHDLHMHEAGIAVKKMLKKMHIPTMPEPTQYRHV